MKQLESPSHGTYKHIFTIFRHYKWSNFKFLDLWDWKNVTAPKVSGHGSCQTSIYYAGCCSYTHLNTRSLVDTEGYSIYLMQAPQKIFICV